MVGRFRKTPETTSRARRLRRDATTTEKALWLYLRSAQIAGVSFRRQHPVGRYFADFCAPSLKLIIELDGGQHADAPGDEVRTRWLAASGYRVLRFWNTEVIENMEGVVEEIGRVVRERKQQTTSP